MSEFAVRVIPKQCLRCGREWEGNAILPLRPDEPRRLALCDRCIATREAELHAILTKPVEPERVVRQPSWVQE